MMFVRVSVAALCCGLAIPTFAQTPPLAYVQLLAPPALRAVQERLHQQGAYAGAVDGTWGQDNQTALQQFQQSHGLQATGQINPATAQQLGLDPVRLLQLAPAPEQPPLMRLGPDAIRNIQQRLAQLGYYRGGLDGAWGPGTEAAVTALQQSRGIQPTGQLNPPTVSAMGLDPRNPGAPAP
jgi:peptidoglycan hydrolase-like protein with peptidoglycan-binding domain